MALRDYDYGAEGNLSHPHHENMQVADRACPLRPQAPSQMAGQLDTLKAGKQLASPLLP